MNGGKNASNNNTGNDILQPAENIADNVPPGFKEDLEIAYNLREEERPAGLKVRYKITVLTGPEARELDARQAEVIWELLRWAQQQQT